MELASLLRPTVPNRYSSLMSISRQEELARKRERAVSKAPAANLLLPEFFEHKVQTFEAGIDHLKCYQDGLAETLQTERLSECEYQNEIETLDKKFKPVIQELHLLRHKRQHLEEIAGDEYRFLCNRLKPSDNALASSIIERSYLFSLMSNMNAATGNQKKSKLEQAGFRRDVIAYYKALRNPGDNMTFGYCHISGWWYDASEIKTAHLVPEALHGDELAFLFGVRKVTLDDPRNGISLYKNIESALRKGVIAIIPVSPPTPAGETKWKCVLVDEQYRERAYATNPAGVSYYGDLDGKELTFLGETHPARRYLYFRFIMTYLQAMRSGNTSWTERIDSRTVYWATPGKYVEKSALLAVGRNLTGFELPEALYENTTFEAKEPMESECDVVLAMNLRQALREENQENDMEEKGEEEEEEEDGNSSLEHD